jgi:hypothetical protein
MALSQKYLERVRRLSQEKDQPKTVRLQQMARVEQAIRQQRIKYQKEGWRASAKWLEQNCEEYQGNGEVSTATNGTGSSFKCLNSEPSTVEPQPLANAPESPQSAPAALPSLLPIPLASAFWQALLYGSRDALVSPSDANTALRLVASELSTDLDVIESTESIRVNTLREVLDAWFGAGAWPAMNKLWRSALASPGAPQPSEARVSCHLDCCPSAVASHHGLRN